MSRWSKMISEEKKQYLQNIGQEMETHQGIVIYGAGVYGKNLARFLQENGFQVRVFCVSERMGNRREECGIPIQSLEDVVQGGKNDVYLIAAEPPKNQAMIRTLREHGISSYVDITPHFFQMLDPVYFRPIVEITSRVGCSMHCRYCPQDLFIMKYRSSDRPLVTSFDSFKTCLDKLPKEVIIDFAGFAEPFLNPAIIDMMEYACESGHDLRLYTTLTGLSPTNLERVLKIPFLSVVLHLPDKNNYANIPMTKEYFQMLDACLSATKTDGYPFVDHANAQCEPPSEILERIDGRVRVTWDMIDWAGNIETQEVRSSGEKRGALLCALSAHQNHNILLPDGSILLCCMDWGMNHILGNLLTDSYETIMQGRIICQIRADMENEEIRPSNFLCTRCTSAMEVKQ